MRRVAKQQCFPTSPATIANGAAFIGTNRGLHAVDVKTGNALWTAGLSSPKGTPVVFGDLKRTLEYYRAEGKQRERMAKFVDRIGIETVKDALA